MLFFIFINFNIVLSYNLLSSCIYPQFYWVNNLSKSLWPKINENQTILTENLTICGTRWIDLMSIDVTLIDQENLSWLLLFHQYCIASLNRVIVNNFYERLNKTYIESDIITFLQSQLLEIKQYIFISFDLLERYCDKMPELQNSQTIDIMDRLYNFNSGTIIGYCSDIYNNDSENIYKNINNSLYQNNNFTGIISLILDYGNTELDSIQKQFIYLPFILNFIIDKEFALCLFILLLFMSLLIVIQNCFFYGGCIKFRKSRLDYDKSIENRCTFQILRMIRKVLLCYCCIQYFISKDNYEKQSDHESDLQLSDLSYSQEEEDDDNNKKNE